MMCSQQKCLPFALCQQTRVSVASNGFRVTYALWQTLWIVQLIYCMWASFGLFVTDPAKLTTPLPSSCSWPLPPPVAERSPHPSAPPFLSTLSQPHTTSCPPPQSACLPASGGSPARGGWVTLSHQLHCLHPGKHHKNMNLVSVFDMKTKHLRKEWVNEG